MSAYDDSVKRINEVLIKNMEPIIQIQKTLSTSVISSNTKIIAKALEPYRNLSQVIQNSLSTSFSNIIESSLSGLSQNVSKSMHDALNEALKSTDFSKEWSYALHDITPNLDFASRSHAYDSSEKLGGLPEEDNDDFVIVDEDAIKTYELPDSVCIPLGNCRIKLPTSIFIAIIGIIVTIFIPISQSLSSSKSAKQQLEIEQTQAKLLKFQNDTLQQLLHNVDVSFSSEAEAIRELKEAVEEQGKQCSQIQDTNSLTSEDFGTSAEVEDTDCLK